MGVRMRTIAIANQKGGVGKTTTTLNLGIGLADRGRRVLLIDADAQSHLTYSLGVDLAPDARALYHVLLDRTPIEGVVVRNRGVDLLPGTPQTANAETMLVQALAREQRLKSALAAVDDRYDYALIDCPPNLGLVVVNALVAANAVMVPVEAKQLAFNSLAMFYDTVLAIRREVNPELRFLGVLPTRYDRRTNHQRQVLEALQNLKLDDAACFSPVPICTRIDEASSLRVPICDHDVVAGAAYQALAKEIDAAMAV
jgi:chromosome partitioning protein